MIIGTGSAMGLLVLLGVTLTGGAQAGDEGGYLDLGDRDHGQQCAELAREHYAQCYRDAENRDPEECQTEYQSYVAQCEELAAQPET